MDDITVENGASSKTSVWTRSKKWLFRLNIYAQERTLTIDEQRSATRINLAMFMVILLTMIIIQVFTPRTTSATVSFPSSDRFQDLVALYPSTLSCPCSRVIFPYKSFSSFAPRFHHICSSHLISASWIESLFSVNASRYHPLDFRNSASSQFQVLSLFCRFAIQLVSNALEMFLQENLISTHAISSELLQKQIEGLIQRLKSTTIAHAMRIDQFLTLMMDSNRLESTLQTNYFVVSIPGERVYYTYAAFYLEEGYTNISASDNYCSCAATSNCTYPAGFYTNHVRVSEYFRPPSLSLFMIPGQFVGCLPRSAILRATLECFYDQQCLNILSLLGIYTRSMVPLNRSVPSRFPVVTTMQVLFDELFLEELGYTSNFSEYYEQCRPISCSYSYPDRISLSSTLSMMISLLSGLVIICHLLGYMVVSQLLRRIRKPLHSGNVLAAPQSPQMSAQQALLRHVRNLWQYLIAFNLFQDSAILANVTQQRWATRIRIALLVMSFSILSIYSAIDQRTISVTVHNPTWDQFKSLSKKYSFTLSCPCNELSISHGSMIHIEPQFHQVCSSDLIREDRWPLYFDVIRKNETLRTFILFSQDFRAGPGQSFFLLLRALCQYAMDTVKDALTIFDNTQFVSNEALSEVHFEERTSILIHQFQEQTLNVFTGLFNLIRTMVEDNHFHVSTDTNLAFRSYFIDNSWLLRLSTRVFWAPDNGSCVCLLNETCLRSQGFYCFDPRCHGPRVFPNFTIPGLYLGCFPVHSLFVSTLECFYDDVCIQTLLDRRLFDISDYVEALQLNLTRLNSTGYEIATTTAPIASIVSRSFIEGWEVKSDAEDHYRQCRPSLCSYTYIAKSEAIYIITSVIGLLGGLSIVFQFLIPLCVVVSHHIWNKTKRNVVVDVDQRINRNEQSRDRLKAIQVRARQTLTAIDFFPDRVVHSLWATRIYILVFMISLVIIFFIVGFSHLSLNINVRHPSQSTFMELHRLYSRNHFSCPCSQSSIVYRTFLNISARYHQICSSYYISMQWRILLITRGYDALQFLDQALFSNHFRILASFCRLSKQAIDDAIEEFLTDRFISIETLTPDDFSNQINATISAIIHRVPMSFLQSLDYMTDMFRFNQLEHLFLSNWMIAFSSPAENYVLSSSPRSYNNGTCTCATAMNNSCWWSLTFAATNTTTMKLPGFVGGCLPIDGLRLSRLQCLFDQLCVKRMQQLLPLEKRSMNLSPLVDSEGTRFPSATTTVDRMIQELFVEEWLNQSNYSKYYEACEPRLCRYTLTARSAPLYVVTTFVGLYGGITLCLRIVVLAGFTLFDGIRSHEDE